MDPQPEKRSWQITLSLVLSALGILVFTIQAFLLAFLGSTLTGFLAVPEAQSIPIGMLVWSSILSALILLPVFLISLRQYQGKPLPTWLTTQRPAHRKIILWSILLWPIVTLAGWQVAGSPALARFLLGPINLLVAGLPILWIFNLAQWKIEGGSAIRKWRLFGFSLTVTPGLIMVLELFAAMTLLGIAGLWWSSQAAADPQITQTLQNLIDQMRAGVDDPEVLLGMLEPLLLQPAVIYWGLAVFAVVMPVIEEVLKPLALWALAGKRITEQEGFVGGLVCGAGFALIENVLFFTTAAGAEDWLFLAVGRAGTGVLHMLASGLAGWGLAKMWRRGKWFTLVLATLGAITLHGLWNALSLISGIVPLVRLGEELTPAQTLLSYLPTLILLIFSAGAMLFINRRLRRLQAAQTPSLILTSPEEQ